MQNKFSIYLTGFRKNHGTQHGLLKMTGTWKLKLHIPFDNYMFKVNDRNTRTRCEIQSALIISAANKKLKVLSKMNHCMKQNRKELILSSSISIRHFTYCPLIRMFCSEKSTKKINAVHEISLRIILNLILRLRVSLLLHYEKYRNFT